MITCLGKSCSFGLPRVSFVNCCQFMYLVISLLVLRGGYRIWLYQFLIIAYLFTLLFKWNIGGCHVQSVRHWLFISWSSVAVSEQVGTPFGLLVRKPRCACRWWGGSLWRTSSSVPSTWFPWLKRGKQSWRATIKPQKGNCTIRM